MYQESRVADKQRLTTMAIGEKTGGRDWKPGESGNPAGRPVFSIVSKIKAKLQGVPEGQHEALIDILIDEYINNVRKMGKMDAPGMRDLIDRFDGKPRQHVSVSDDRQEAWRGLQRDAFIQSETEEDMEALQEEDESTEAVDPPRRSAFGEDLA